MIQFVENNISLKKEILENNFLQVNSSKSLSVDLDHIDLVTRSYLTIKEMREAGSFFTGQDMATQVVDNFVKPITEDSVVLDPTCGAGNLLIECSRRLPIKICLKETLILWNKVLRGFDIYESFIEATKLRLIIEAINRGCQMNCSLSEAISLLYEIRVIDALTVSEKDILEVTHLIMNPPFSLWPSPKRGFWKKGKVNAAAVILEYYLERAPIDCCLSAILPDVLRSGTRYELFREFVSSSLNAKTKILGRFNQQTDVDVFLLMGIIKKTHKFISWHDVIDGYYKLGDYFNVCVGPLVAYRDPEVDKEYPFLHARNIGKWIEIKEISEKRRFSGKVMKSPFIVIKRTSSPSDCDRAVASIVNIKNSEVAIENHLIVVTPKSGKLSDCRKLLKILASKDTNNFLNNRIRMRHLTVGVIKDIPYIINSLSK